MPTNPTTFRIEIRNSEDLMQLVGTVRSFATASGISTYNTSRMATVASELATNLLKYAKNGFITARCSPVPKLAVVIESHDEGPGIPDLESAMRDHFSTSGTLGVGLPGVRRLSDHFEIQSSGSGTLVRCELSL